MNEQVLSTVPVFEGAAKLTEYSFGDPASDACFPGENSAPYDAFWTYELYALPPGVSDNEVLDFYDERLVDWVPVTIRTAEVRTCDVSYRRGRALLGVMACNGTLRLGVNHAAYP
jgi:hypothetical protein